MARGHEAYGCCYRDLTGTTLTLYGKQNKTRTVEISQRLADAINTRHKSLGAGQNDLIFPNRNGNPDQHLLRDLRTLAKRAGAQFAVELHKLRKTGASRRCIVNEPLTTLMLELGHDSLATTQRYPADVRNGPTTLQIQMNPQPGGSVSASRVVTFASTIQDIDNSQQAGLIGMQTYDTLKRIVQDQIDGKAWNTAPLIP